MDFGNILDEWDRQSSKLKGKREEISPKAQTSDNAAEYALPKSNKAHSLIAWLRIHGVYDKDAETLEGDDKGWERRRRLLHKQADAVIDLHGLTQDEAWLALEAFFQNSRSRDFEKLLIIHGKGNHSKGEGVLKRTVQKFIERCPFAGKSGHGNSASGGTGTTWVLLKG